MGLGLEMLLETMERMMAIGMAAVRTAPTPLTATAILDN
jgi:hypothetical protein